MTFHFTEQLDAMDCGATCLQMVSSYYGRNYSLGTLRDLTYAGVTGVSMLGISKAAEALGFRSIGGKFTIERLAEKAPLPCIVHWDQEHFVVVYKVKKNRKGEYTVFVADPGKGLLKYTPIHSTRTTRRPFSKIFPRFTKERPSSLSPIG